jgi:hypothetical protein
MGRPLLMPQTTVQILRCLNLGRYSAKVEDGQLWIQGPQPLAGPLPASIKARRDELVEFLNELCDGVWPPAKDSGLVEAAEFLGCGVSVVLDIVEAAEKRAA